MKIIHLKKRPSIITVVFLSLLFLFGCKTIPEIKDLISEYDIEVSPPIILDAEGPLPVQESQAKIRALRQEADPTDILKRHIAWEESLTGQPLIAGNKVELLCDGPQTFASMGEAILNATDHINLETFIWRDDEVGRPLADLLIRKRKEGVQVNAIYDSFGTLNTPRSFFDRMSANGINLIEFNPIGVSVLSGGWSINNRDHRKVLVVDGKIAFTGGINFYRVYAESPSNVSWMKADPQMEYYWRDMHVKIEGPAVAEFQKCFMEMWSFQNGPDISGNYFPSLEEVGDSLVRVIASTPDQPISSIYATYISAISHAERSVHLTHAYLVMNEDMLEALSEAPRKGVAVKIIVPSFSDLWLPFYAARYSYSRLLKAGVRIFEKQGALLHSKTAVVDGVWSTVGSSNLNSRSFLHDAEINAVILGRDFGIRMEAVFEKDLARSDEILLHEWERRPIMGRLKERIARLFKYWL
jgi:cardiolipin synthase A/B